MNLKFKSPSDTIEFQLEYGGIITRDDIIEKSGLMVIDGDNNDLSEYVVIENHKFDNGIRVTDSFSYQVSWSIVIEGDEQYTGNDITMNVDVIKQKEQENIIVSKLDEKSNNGTSITLGEILELGKNPGDYIIPSLKLDLSNFNNIKDITLNVWPVLKDMSYLNDRDLAVQKSGTFIDNEYTWSFDTDTKFPFSDNDGDIYGLMYKMVITIEEPIVEKVNDPWASVMKQDEPVSDQIPPVVEQKKDFVDDYKSPKETYVEPVIEREPTFKQFTNSVNSIEHPLDMNSNNISDVGKRSSKKGFKKDKKIKPKKQPKQPKQDKIVKEKSNNGLKSIIIYGIITIVLLSGSGAFGYNYYNKGMKSIEPKVQEITKNQKEAENILGKDTLSSDDVSKLSQLLNNNQSSLDEMSSKNIFVMKKRDNLTIKNNELVDKANKDLNQSSDKTTESSIEKDTSDSK